MIGSFVPVRAEPWPRAISLSDMMNTRLVAVGLVSIFGVVGCGWADNAASPGGSSDPTGRTFVSSMVTVDGVPMPLAKGTQLTLVFTDDGISASAGCNTMGGQGSAQGGALVMDGELSMTEMGCDRQRMEQDQWFADLLTSTPALALDGDQMTLTSRGTVIALTED